MPSSPTTRRAPKAKDPTRRIADKLCRQWLQRLFQHGESAARSVTQDGKEAVRV